MRARTRPRGSAETGGQGGAREILVALGLAGGAVVALGFTRFAYALLLPPMRTDLDWTFTAAGGMNTANAVGYVLGAATAAVWARVLGSRAAFTSGIVLSALMLLALGLTANYVALTTFRFLGGVSTAVTFVLGSALAARAHSGGRPQRSALLVALYMAGVGLGIIVSGIVVPTVLAIAGEAAWPAGWLAMGVLAAITVAPALWAARQVGEQAARSTDDGRVAYHRLTPLFAWYVLFGAGYVSYMTFIIALLQEQRLDTRQVAVFFIVLGAASVLATLLLWSRVITRMRRGHAPAVIAAAVALGVLPVLVWDGLAAALVSAVVFGSTFMAGPTAATVLARRMLPAHGWTPGIALLTVAFSVGQAIGPLLAGALSDTEGGIELGLWLSVALLALAASAALAQRDVVAPAAAAHATTTH